MIMEAKRNEIVHKYGERVHIIHSPYYSLQLAKLCSPETIQPSLNAFIKSLYRGLLRIVIDQEFPVVEKTFITRMNAKLVEKTVDSETKVVTVDIARAGILPSMVCYEELSNILNSKGVRQDHIIINRVVGDKGEVLGAKISGTKIGGSINGRIMIFPDPMGATGSSLCEVLKFYLGEGKENPLKIISLNLIITPEFIKKVTSTFPETIIYAFRLDRGLSPLDVLRSIPGTYWNKEKGLNDQDYIIPGAGGLGEILNNAEI